MIHRLSFFMLPFGDMFLVPIRKHNSLEIYFPLRFNPTLILLSYKASKMPEFFFSPPPHQSLLYIFTASLLNNFSAVRFAIIISPCAGRRIKKKE